MLENFLSLSLLQVVGYIFPLVTLPYLARVIGVEGFGEISFAASIVAYFEAITVFGFNYTAVREIAKIRNDLNAVSVIFSNVFFAKLFLMVISFCIFLIIVYSFPFLYKRRVVMWFTFLYIPGHIMFPDWLFQALEKMKYITIMNFISKLIFSLLVFVVIRDSSDYIYHPVLLALGYLFSGLVSIIFLVKILKIKFVRPRVCEIKKTLKNSFSMFVSLFLPNLYTNFSVTLLGYSNGPIDAGVFSSGKKFIDLCDQFIQILSRTFFPFLARKIEKHEVYAKISFAISIVFSLFLFIGADFLIKMSISPFFLFLMNTYGVNYLVLKNHEVILRNIVIVCSLGGFIIAWIAVINFSYVGVAWTIMLTWGIRGYLTWFYANKVIKKCRARV